MYEHLAPGGYFEFSESGFTLHSDDGTSEGSKIGYYFEFLNECAKKGGLVFPTEDVRCRCGFEGRGARKAGQYSVRLLMVAEK